MTREELRRQKERKIHRILSLIANHTWLFGYQPSLRELADVLGWKSPNYVLFLLRDHFKNHKGGRNGCHSRAVEFDWRKYVTEDSVPWDHKQDSRKRPALRTQAKRKAAKRQLGRLPKSA